ncbi:transport protein, Tim44-like domain, putative [Citrifermentans bemidjiense Bem]|uniref:Transport protein, Tim44-like domain, putative n=1 Tax=Citrifermentans bemidjiense (strain ATCC BAA-1014 / DSM 16622 / JCM 12645 / Bem) TaxID=404380 RepID=B5EIY6_CITBB|nr:Tim44 domain-containing protein [Citrifermentans bemidjiense]ACH39941.1 transport protein, Tim44-like domain, putative [Citrifermentans bemidjiense Bem]
MKRHLARAFTLAAAVLFLSVTVLEMGAEARVGGGRSMGSRGTRSYSGQAAPSYAQPQGSAYRQQVPPTAGPMQQQGGSFLRSMAGGVAGGLLGGMLFRGMAGAGGVGGAGGGIGIFEILLLAGIGYLIYRMVKKRRSEAALQGAGSYSYGGYEQQGATISAPYRVIEPSYNDVATGLSHLRQMDPGFDEGRFNDLVMDNFFKIQGGWMNRDLAVLAPLVTEEMKGIFRDDIDRLLRDRQVNRLENIAVRNVEITEVWQEAGQDYVTARIYANLLDYTTDENGQVITGSKTEPVKFEELWTFARPVGNNPWRLSGINQV